MLFKNIENIAKGISAFIHLYSKSQSALISAQFPSRVFSLSLHLYFFPLCIFLCLCISHIFVFAMIEQLSSLFSSFFLEGPNMILR